MQSLIYTIALFLSATLSYCQLSQATTKSVGSLPKDEEIVYTSVSEGIKNNNRDFEKLGYQKGEKVPELTLFSPEGMKFTLSEVLAKNKPVLLISGSYTCDISRSNLIDINAMSLKYTDKVNVYLVYTIDAHPVDVASPYSQTNEINLATANVRENIEAEQPKTYGERKLLAQNWKQQNDIMVPVIVDSPFNEFWLSYGQAPNTAYLIEPSGTVYFKQAWFDYFKMDDAIGEWLRSQAKK